MRGRRRQITVFSISALDLFAAALGAFILIVLILFPYYRLGGTDTSMDELQELVLKRRTAADTTRTEMAQIRALEVEIRQLDRQYASTSENLDIIKTKIEATRRAVDEVEVPEPVPDPIPTPVPEPTPEPPRPAPPQSRADGQEFSILGVATNKDDVIIVVDMSGSMNAHKSKVVDALYEILDQLSPRNRFAIIGYRGGPSYDSFPSSGQLTRADDATLDRAYSFVDALPRRFGGGTPTQTALLRAINNKPEAIILISDGAPDDGRPGDIVTNITRRNRGRAEIHTVAIGDYTQDKALTLFLQALANSNRGDFVGRAR